jgi:Bacterial Ig-like domain (group 1)
MRTSLRYLERTLVTALAVALTTIVPATTASASHVPPTVQDFDIGNLPNNERELSIAVDPNDPDRLAAGVNDRGGAAGTTGQRWYSSTDGGRNWNTGQLPTGTLTLDGVASPTMSDPSLDYGSNGEIYYSTLMHGGDTDPCTLFVVESADQGQNWTNAANGVVRAGTQADDECNDKEMIAVDRNNNDNVYVAWTPIGGPLNREVQFSRDLNGASDGFAFSAPVELSTAPAPAGCLNQGTDFALDGSGNIYVAWTSFCSGTANGDPGTVFVARSTNQGGAWSAPVAAATLDNANPAVDPGFRARSHPSIDVDPATGRVFVVYATNANTSTHSDPDVMIVSAPTGGTAWTTPIRVNTDVGTTDQLMPWIDVANGRIHVNFYSRAGGGGNWNDHFAFAPVSASPTFTEITVSSAPTPATTGFLGDYTGNIVGSDDVAHPAWGDGRASSGGVTDAHAARVNFSPATTVVLSPLNPTREVGTNVTFTATVLGAHGEVETFIPVSFSVTSSGSPSSLGASGVTDASGQFQFTYTNTVTGTDGIHVFADLDEDGTEDPGETVDTTVTWTPGPPATLDLTPATATNVVDSTHVLNAHVEDRFGNAVPAITVRFSVSGANEVFGMPSSGSDVTDASGDATFSYIGVFPGSDTITAFADFNDDGVRDPNPAAHEPQDTATKVWTLPASTVGNVRGGGWIVTEDGHRANFGFTFKMKAGAPGPKGHLTYLEHANGHLKVKSISVDALVVTGSSAKIFGTAHLKGNGAVVFRIDVTDNGEPGRGHDRFQLRLSNGHDSGAQILRGGNIQVE